MSSATAYKEVLHDVNCKYGAPSDRGDVGTRPTDKRIFDRQVPISQGYDGGGVYWGMGNPLRVSYTEDLEYIHFYREDDEYRENGRMKYMDVESLPLYIETVKFESSKSIIEKRIRKGK